MKKFLFGFLGSIAFIHAAEAKIPVIDPAIGYALDAIIAVAGQSNLEITESLKPMNNPKELHRAQILLQRIRDFSDGNFRYSNSQVVLIQGNPGEPNAFCTGPSIYLSKSLLNSLNDRQLSAVLAHELAHAERGHLTQRMSHGFAALLVQLGRTSINNSDFILHRDRADAFIRELASKGHWQMIQEMIESAELGQEMQADCDAYTLLGNMHAKGLDNQPQDISSAVLAILDIPAEFLDGNDFMGARVKTILSDAYSNGRCD